MAHTIWSALQIVLYRSIMFVTVALKRRVRVIISKMSGKTIARNVPANMIMLVLSAYPAGWYRVESDNDTFIAIVTFDGFVEIDGGFAS